jgi:tetratricopeptide (TPR) repeat protein
VYVLDPTAAAAASAAEAETVLDWARTVGRAGRIDEAVALYRSVTREPMRTRAIAALGALLLASSSADAARGAYPSAIARLEQIITLAPETAAAAQAQRQLPIDQAGEAGRLLTAGDGPDAVRLLATVVAGGSTVATRTADSLYPEALLVAGQEEIAQLSFVEALADLQHLVTGFPQSEHATQARALLTAPQQVSGTLVDRAGIAASGPVRLSTNYKAEPGGTYKTSGPFYTATADRSGDFTFTAVPVGGPYVLEVFSDGNWTTLIDPSTGQPAHPVKVTALIPVDLTFVVLPS